MKTIYTTEASDGTIRWACNKMNSAPRMHQDVLSRPKIKWTFRIIFDFSEDNILARSCRGSCCEYYGNGIYDTSRNHFETIDDAIRWLAG